MVLDYSLFKVNTYYRNHDNKKIVNNDFLKELLN